MNNHTAPAGDGAAAKGDTVMKTELTPECPAVHERTGI